MGAVKDYYTSTYYAFSGLQLVLALALAVLLFRTTPRSLERPRGEQAERLMELDHSVSSANFLQRSNTNKSYYQMLAGFLDTQHQEPKIKVTIKPRTKDRPTDAFRLNVQYEIELSDADKRRLSLEVPSTPLNKTDDEKQRLIFDSQIEEEKSDKPKCGMDTASKDLRSLNLEKMFDEILELESLVHNQFNKQRDLIKYMQFTMLKGKDNNDWKRKYATFKATCPRISNQTKLTVLNPHKSESAKAGRFVSDVSQIFDQSTKLAF